MRLITLLNHCQHFPGFVYEKARLCPESSTIEIHVRPRRGSKPVCSGCHKPAAGYDMYDSEYFFVANPINRYSISPRQNLKANPDGSVDLYIQNESPGPDKESNWLPAPGGKFQLMLRLYWPNERNPSILNGSWKIPQVKKVS